MIFILDNYDSFTYNLVQYMGELGAELVVHRNDRITCDEIEALAPEKIVISPGPCTPDVAGISLEMVTSQNDAVVCWKSASASTRFS